MNFRKSNKPRARVEIYSKPDCHLCDQAKAVLLRVRKRHPFELVEVDITQDARYAEFREQIPVIFVNARKAFKYRVDEREFIRTLEQA
jgi:glutaredoxin